MPEQGMLRARVPHAAHLQSEDSARRLAAERAQQACGHAREQGLAIRW